MIDTVTHYRNKTLGTLYKGVFKPLFFLRDPENVHDRMVGVGKRLGGWSMGRTVTRWFFGYRNSKLQQTIFGINFENPIGLSAGFDKNADLTDILPSVGFGFAEVGSITGEPCLGNAKPRLWRLPKSKSLGVYYGLKNDGCENIALKLEAKQFAIPVGMSVAMTNSPENLVIKNAIADFAKAFRVMEPLGAYITVNISCPNTQGGQPFIIPHNFDYLFDILDEIPTAKPIFIKLSPDLTEKQLNDLLDIARRHRIHGIICANLTKKPDARKIIDASVPTAGGFSGKMVQELADAMLAAIYKREGQRFTLVGCGGVFNAADAYKKIRLGASLVQMITGMIFEGPQVISEINQGLVKFLERDGFSNIREAIGVDNGRVVSLT